MDSNVIGILVSVGYILAVLIIAKLFFALSSNVSSEVVRKFVHIAASNWWFILITFFTDVWASICGPLAFIIVNCLATFLNWTRFLGWNDQKRNYGLIYFPISLLALVLLTNFKLVSECNAGIGILVMGYGDGFAAIIGQRFGKAKIHYVTGKKTYAGSMTMFLVSVIVIIVMTLRYGYDWIRHLPGLGVVVAIAAISTVVEAATPMGLDNVTVPIGTAVLLELVSRLLF
jgi:phytol kinase